MRSQKVTQETDLRYRNRKRRYMIMRAILNPSWQIFLENTLVKAVQSLCVLRTHTVHFDVIIFHRHVVMSHADLPSYSSHKLVCFRERTSLHVLS